MKKIGIVMGSDSDLPVIQKATDTLKTLGIPFEVHVFSAHRTPDQARDFARTARIWPARSPRTRRCLSSAFPVNLRP